MSGGAPTPQAAFDVERFLAEERERIERALETRVDGVLERAEARLAEAVRYSLLAGGKRLRPILAVVAARTVGGRDEDAIDAALAIELIHTYSLIHDDLPCMDDDDLRRGRPTSHKVFGEALALLAGDALLTGAFELLAGGAGDPAIVLAVVADVARAAGVGGMVEGQVIDLANERQHPDVGVLERMHALKTGALIEVSLTAGARLGGGDADDVEALARYGRTLGLAFQVADDLLDVLGDTAVLGKEAAKDARLGKATFPALLGIDASRARARELVDEACAAVARFGDRAVPLVALATWVVERDR